METPDTEWKIRIREYLNESREYVGDTDDLESVCLDGYFNLEEIAQIIISSQRAHWLRSEIEKLKKKFKPTQIIDNGDGTCTRTDMYIQGQNDDLNFGYNQALTSIITRYKEELLELEKHND